MVERVPLPRIIDARGQLTFGEYPGDLPFQPVRFFVVQHVSADQSRGGHGHRTCSLILVMLAGACDVHIWDTPTSSVVVRLVAGGDALLLRPGTYSEQRSFSADAVLLGLASETYDVDEYVSAQEYFGID